MSIKWGTVHKGGFVPIDEAPDPYGKNPEELLLEKERQCLAEEGEIIELNNELDKDSHSKMPEDWELKDKDEGYETDEPKREGSHKSASIREKESFGIRKFINKGKIPQRGQTSKKKGWIRKSFEWIRGEKERPQDQL